MVMVILIYLCFGIKDVKYIKYMKTFNLVGYMNDRIDLIIKRGYRILNNRAITEDELKEVKSYINRLLKIEDE